MKYYAVTEDPRELFHYGVKGMKWGQHLFGEDLKPKSPSYKRAANKLRALSKKTNEGLKTTANAVSSSVRKGIVKKNTIGNALKRTVAQISYNYNKHKQNQFNKAVQKAQIRNNLTAALHSLDKEEKYRKEIDRERKAAEYNDKIRNIRADNDLKQLRNSVKIERKMPKYMQQAREGLTGYGKFTEEQLGRIQERLSMENMTRRLGGNEYPKFRTRLKKATQEGIIEGTRQGVANAMVEVAKAKVQNKYGNRKTLDQQNAIRAQRKHDADRIEKERTDHEIKRDLKKETYESELRSGKGYMSRHGFGSHMTIADAGKITSENRERQAKIADETEAYKAKLRENRELDKAYNDYLEENGLSDAEYRKQYKRLLEERANIPARPTGMTDAEYKKLLDESDYASRESRRFNKMTDAEQRRYLQRQENRRIEQVEKDEKENKEREEKLEKQLEDARMNAIRKENQDYQVRLKDYNDEMREYYNQRNKYQNWVQGKGPRPRKPVRPKPPKMPVWLLGAPNAGGKNKNK